MKLFPRHKKVLEAANGYSDLNYINQRSGVRSATEVAKELYEGGYLKLVRGPYAGCDKRYKRTEKGDEALEK